MFYFLTFNSLIVLKSPQHYVGHSNENEDKIVISLDHSDIATVVSAHLTSEVPYKVNWNGIPGLIPGTVLFLHFIHIGLQSWVGLFLAAYLFSKRQGTSPVFGQRGYSFSEGLL